MPEGLKSAKVELLLITKPCPLHAWAGPLRGIVLAIGVASLLAAHRAHGVLTGLGG